MAYPVWQPGTLYQPGDIVVPITAPSPTATAVENGDFSAGASNWDFTGAAFYSTHVSKGGWRTAVELPGNQPSGGALNQTKLVVPVGKKITATCLIDQGASIAGATRGWVEVHWFSGTDVLLRVDKGNQVDSGAGGAVHPSTCESTCPEGAAYCRAGIELWSVADHNHAVWGGNLQVDGTFAGLPSDLAYKAVQPESGFSDASEPAWPPVLGQQVVDNEVTWEAIASTRVVWAAEPLYVSGDTEPEWPEEEGGMVKDGTVTLRAVSRRVEDPNCPNTKIVAIAASKVFCGDDDIVRYSATVNPLDWSTDNDAGYLPTGLQNYGANPVTAMGLYRGNLIVFNAEAFQLWQVDEEPASMALLDALPMGSTHHHAIAPVSNDLLFLASQGVRTLGIAASSTNFQAGDVGMPVDPLVQGRMENSVEPAALYYPAMGQYWLMFPHAGAPPAVPPQISGQAPDGEYDFPYDGYAYTLTAGTAPIVRVSVVDGSLPPGLTLDRGTGTLEAGGVPTAPGSYQFVLRVEDANGLYADLADEIHIGAGAIACGVSSAYSGGQSFPTEFEVVLGTGTGTVTLDYLTGQNPDRFVVTFDGVDVIDTGYVGDPDYIEGGQTYQQKLDAYMLAHGLPQEDINMFNPAYVEGDTNLDTNPGTMHASFVKSSPTSMATVKIYGPLPGTGWSARLGCPNADEGNP